MSENKVSFLSKLMINDLVKGSAGLTVGRVVLDKIIDYLETVVKKEAGSSLISTELLNKLTSLKSDAQAQINDRLTKTEFTDFMGGISPETLNTVKKITAEILANEALDAEQAGALNTILTQLGRKVEQSTFDALEKMYGRNYVILGAVGTQEENQAKLQNFIDSGLPNLGSLAESAEEFTILLSGGKWGDVVFGDIAILNLVSLSGNCDVHFNNVSAQGLKSVSGVNCPSLQNLTNGTILKNCTGSISGDIGELDLVLEDCQGLNISISGHLNLTAKNSTGDYTAGTLTGNYTSVKGDFYAPAISGTYDDCGGRVLPQVAYYDHGGDTGSNPGVLNGTFNRFNGAICPFSLGGEATDTNTVDISAEFNDCVGEIITAQNKNVTSAAKFRRCRDTNNTPNSFGAAAGSTANGVLSNCESDHAAGINGSKLTLCYAAGILIDNVSKFVIDDLSA